MKTLTGHLTATNKKAIQAILNLGLTSAKVNNINYFLTEKENGLFEVKIQKMDRGLIPCPGSELRLSTSIATFKN
jgi:hypothetical protein